MSVKTYDPNEVICIVGGAIISGYADGTYLNVERDEQMFQKVVGADGFVSRAKSNNKSGVLTLTLQQTSPSNDVLSGFMVADELTNSGIVPVFIKDAIGTTVLVSGEGWVQQMPAVGYAKEVNNREWSIAMAQINAFVGGNQITT